MALHPFLVAMLEQIREAGRPRLSDGTPEQARALVALGRTALGIGPEMAEVRRLSVPARGGSIAALLFLPTREPSALVIYLHGGGWVVGALADYETLARQIAFESHSAVLLPDYRLAPEHPFPAGLEDVEDTLLWVARGQGVLERELPVVVAGDSAGGNLATVALRRLRGRSGAKLQVLIYPVTSGRLDTPSYREENEGMPLTRRDMEWFLGHYARQSQWTTPDISPLHADDLGGLPPALVMVAEHDVLRDEGAAYAAKLRAAGIAVDIRRYDGVTHGFIRLHNLFEIAREAVSDVAAAISRAAGRDRKD
jgi:acetyl esterase